jgi:ABC-type anion transport system duplicated permease subunit
LGLFIPISFSSFYVIIHSIFSSVPNLSSLSVSIFLEFEENMGKIKVDCVANFATHELFRWNKKYKLIYKDFRCANRVD